MTRIFFLVLSILLTTEPSWSVVLRVKEKGKLVENLLLSTGTPQPHCRMKGEVIEECFFDLKIYSCTDELRIYSAIIQFENDTKKQNLMKNVLLNQPSHLSKLGRFIKSFEIDRVALIGFNRHFPVEQINRSQFKCELRGDSNSSPLKTNFECSTTGPLKVRFEESSEEVNISKWCEKPFIIR
jgi:hypothetical protein